MKTSNRLLLPFVTQAMVCGFWLSHCHPVDAGDAGTSSTNFVPSVDGRSSLLWTDGGVPVGTVTRALGTDGESAEISLETSLSSCCLIEVALSDLPIATNYGICEEGVRFVVPLGDVHGFSCNHQATGPSELITTGHATVHCEDSIEPQRGGGIRKPHSTIGFLYSATFELVLTCDTEQVSEVGLYKGSGAVVDDSSDTTIPCDASVLDSVKEKAREIAQKEARDHCPSPGGCFCVGEGEFVASKTGTVIKGSRCVHYAQYENSGKCSSPTHQGTQLTTDQRASVA